jgi:hypothetical protein
MFAAEAIGTIVQQNAEGGVKLTHTLVSKATPALFFLALLNQQQH